MKKMRILNIRFFAVSLTAVLTLFSTFSTPVFANASTPLQKLNKSIPGDPSNMLHQAPWFEGTTEQAFAAAAKTNKTQCVSSRRWR